MPILSASTQPSSVRPTIPSIRTGNDSPQYLASILRHLRKDGNVWSPACKLLINNDLFKIQPRRTFVFEYLTSEFVSQMMSERNHKANIYDLINRVRKEDLQTLPSPTPFICAYKGIRRPRLLKSLQVLQARWVYLVPFKTDKIPTEEKYAAVILSWEFAKKPLLGGITVSLDVGKRRIRDLMFRDSIFVFEKSGEQRRK